MMVEGKNFGRRTMRRPKRQGTDAVKGTAASVFRNVFSSIHHIEETS